MAETKKTSRQKMLERARERFPDRKFAELDAQGPQDGVDDLDDAIDEILTETSMRQTEYDAQNAKLRNLLVSDPSSAEFMNRWVKTGDPRPALVETFGDELGMSDEAKEQFKDQLAGWRERKTANDALENDAAKNWHESLAAMEEWGNARGLTLEQKRDIMVRLMMITFNGMENKYGPEDFELAINAINHDNDVAAARAAGEVAGRNSRIAETRRERSVTGALPPAGSGGQGGRTAETRAQKKRSFWGDVNNDN